MNISMTRLVIKSSRSMLVIAFIAKRVILKILARILIGRCQKVEVGHGMLTLDE
jgi:hypothetical protein